MAQTIDKRFFAAKSLARIVFFSFFLSGFAEFVLVLLKILVPLEIRGFVYGISGGLFFSLLLIPGLVVWKAPWFAHGWLGQFNSLVFPPVPWEKLSGPQKILVYLTSVWGLTLSIFALCAMLFNWLPFCEFMKGYFSTLNCG